MAKEIDRSKQIDMTNSKKAVSIGLYDMDSIIKYYFDNVIQPTVSAHDGNKPVPVIYASPERWKSIAKSGLLRDTKRVSSRLARVSIEHVCADARNS